jgi:hypothetical protein
MGSIVCLGWGVFFICGSVLTLVVGFDVGYCYNAARILVNFLVFDVSLVL